jgi:hypothetical protein
MVLGGTLATNDGKLLSMLISFSPSNMLQKCYSQKGGFGGVKIRKYLLQ